jgi:hypothetical protein
MKAPLSHEWLLLVHLLPQKPTKLRVHVWRRLQALGAVPIKNSVYVLPYSEKTNEDFQWLRQEIESAGGEANLFRAGSVEGATDKEIIALFRNARDADYARLISEFDGLSGAVREQIKRNSLSTSKLAQYQAESSKLRQELDRVTAIDFFEAPQARKTHDAFEKCRRVLQATESKKTDRHAATGDPKMLSANDYQNRRWVTRKDPHIDRLASSWLIRRFIDQRPRFYFVSEDERIENALTFDMTDGNFSHRGEDCTFETMMKSFGLESDAALCEIAEIVHDIDLKDSKFNRPEATGVNAVIMGLAAVHKDDGERLKQCLPVFDAMYKLFGKEPYVSGDRRKGGKKPGRRRAQAKNA